jgi:Zn-dependent protease with chaperone function
MAASTTAPPSAGVDRRTILSAIRGRIAPAPVPIPYRLALGAVAVAMVLLPLVYLGLVAATAYATWWHAVNDVTWLAGKGSARGRLFAYATPLVGGLVAVFFMVKPLLARSAPRSSPLVLDRAKEPFLHDFVERLCRTLGAPAPVRIEVDCEVNASARLVGLAGGGGLVLTIGLPLVAGLTMRQMAGVLAHEFGHFSQGAGMRVSGLIRRVNGWFARVVYERDAWDARLERLGREEGSGGLIVLTARLLVWLSRRMLQGLMLVGHALSCALMRQMEHDADRYEALLAGSDTFAATARRLRVLSAAHQVCHAELAESWKEGRLAADLPGFVAARAASLPEPLTRRITSAVDGGETGWFDTHPCDAERIARTARLRAAGLFRLDGPATALFRDFDGLSREVSLRHYREIAGDAVKDANLVRNESLLESAEERQEAHQACLRLTQGLVDPDHLVFPAEDRGKELDVREARARFEAELPAAREAFRRLERARERAALSAVAGQLLEAGLKLEAKAFQLPVASADGVGRAAARAQAETEQARSALAPWSEALRVRMAAGLGRMDPVEREPALAAFGGLCAGQPALDSLRVSLGVLSALLESAGDSPSSGHVEAVRRASAGARAALAQLTAALGEAPCPFEGAGEPPTLAAHVVPAAPPPDDLPAVVDCAGEALERSMGVYFLLLGRVALAVEEVERASGLSPLATRADGSSGSDVAEG